MIIKTVNKLTSLKLIFAFLVLSPIIDNINGYVLLSGEETNISALYKTLILVLCCLLMVTNRHMNKHAMGYFSIYMFFLFVSTCVSLGWRNSSDGYNLNTTIKMLMPVVLTMFLMTKKNNNNCYEKTKSLLNWFAWFYPLSIIVPSVFGIGFHTYANSAFGNKGFYYAGNELGAIMIILLTYVVQRYERTKDIKSLLCFAINVIVDLLIGVKSLYFGMIVLLLVYLLTNAQYRGIIRKILSLMAIAGIVLLVINAWNKSFFNDLMEIQIWRYNNYALKQGNNVALNFILSGRNTKIASSYSLLSEKCGLLGILFGAGHDYMIKLAGSIIEMDFFDMILWYGIIFTIVSTVLAAALLRKKWSVYTKYERTMILVMFGYSFFAGHVIFAPSVSVVLVLMISSAIFRTHTNNMMNKDVVYE